MRSPLPDVPLELLTPTEKRVMRTAVLHRSVWKAAASAGMSYGAFHCHLSNIRRKARELEARGSDDTPHQRSRQRRQPTPTGTLNNHPSPPCPVPDERVLEALRREPGLTLGELAHRLADSDDAAHFALRDLTARGLIVCAGAGWYGDPHRYTLKGNT